MKEYVEPIDELVKKLALGQQAEVRDFVEFLHQQQQQQQRSNPPEKPRFDWAGALRDMRESYRSVDLQHHLGGLEFWENPLADQDWK